MELSESSSLTRRPAFTRRSFSSAAFSSTPALCMATGRTMTWMGAIFGGRTRPLLSPWAMMTAPIMRVVEPQEVWNGYCSLLSRPVKVTL